MRPISALGAVCFVALALAGTADAVAPTIQKITLQNRHPLITFTAPRTRSVTVYLASKPDRASDGSFLEENLVDLEGLTVEEIQNGRWLYSKQLEPGTYYVLLDASPDFTSCWNASAGAYDPACADGFSDLAKLVVPRPAVHYSTAVTSLLFIKRLELKLVASPLGVRTPYTLCFHTKAKARRCIHHVLAGASWSSPAADILEVSTKALAARTTFVWTVAGKVVARRTLKTQ